MSTTFLQSLTLPNNRVYQVANNGFMFNTKFTEANKWISIAKLNNILPFILSISYNNKSILLYSVNNSFTLLEGELSDQIEMVIYNNELFVKTPSTVTNLDFTISIIGTQIDINYTPTEINTANIKPVNLNTLVSLSPKIYSGDVPPQSYEELRSAPTGSLYIQYTPPKKTEE